MQETEVVLGHHRTAIHAQSGNFQRGPDGVAGEQLVVGGDSCELDHAELHHQVVYKLLRFSLRKCPFLQVTLDIDVKEG